MCFRVHEDMYSDKIGHRPGSGRQFLGVSEDMEVRFPNFVF